MSRPRRLDVHSRRRTLWIEDGVWRRAQQRAAAEDRTVSSYVRWLLKKELLLSARRLS